MTLHSGFFNSYGDDRHYDATDFSKYLDGLVIDGCLPNDIGLLVVEDPGATSPSVIIKAGKAYSHGLWFLNDEDMLYDLPVTVTPNQFYLIYLCFDTNENVRAVSIENVIDSNPTVPLDGAGKYHLPLAKINAVLSGDIQSSDIEDLRIYAGVSAAGVTSGNITDGAVRLRHMATNSVDRINIVNGAIDGSKLDGLSVSEGKIVSLAVTENKIATGAVTRNKIADGVVSTDKLANRAVTAVKMDFKGITTNSSGSDAYKTELTEDLSFYGLRELGDKPKEMRLYANNPYAVRLFFSGIVQVTSSSSNNNRVTVQLRRYISGDSTIIAESLMTLDENEEIAIPVIGATTLSANTSAYYTLYVEANTTITVDNRTVLTVMAQPI